MYMMLDSPSDMFGR